MAKPVKPPSAKKSAKPAGTSGRVTPKQTGRYTPPVPKSEKVSPIWVPIVMFGALGLGMLVILANYVSLLPGDEPSNMYLLLGLVLITTGFITATKYH